MALPVNGHSHAVSPCVRPGSGPARRALGTCKGDVLTQVSTKPFESFTRSASSALIAARAAASAAAFTAAFAFAFSSSTLKFVPWPRQEGAQFASPLGGFRLRPSQEGFSLQGEKTDLRGSF